MTDSVLNSLLGAGVGAGVVYLVLRMGKWLFGRHRLPMPPGSKVIFTETDLHLPDRVVPYEELFYRKSDTVVVLAQTVELADRCYREVEVRLTPECLRIGDEEMNPEEVPHMEVVSGEIVLPREAMGLGDVKFMAGIGAFLGWQAVIFSLMVSSMIGAVIGVLLIVLRRREWSSRIPYGPYIALAAVIWIFWGPRILEAFFGGLDRG